MILYDSGVRRGGALIISLDGPTILGGWRSWLFLRFSSRRKSLFRVLGLEITRRHPS